jgi:hypothetical protein
VSEADYRLIVAELTDAIDGDASPLFERLLSRMATLVDHHRFEDAAQVRDRWESLSRALTSRRAWNSLQLAGRIEATGPDGVSIEIDRGRLVAIWPDERQKPLTIPDPGQTVNPASSMVAFDEAALIWRWLGGPQIRLNAISGTLACPSTRVPVLAPGRQVDE